MFVELIATIVAGVAAAGLVMLLNRLLKGRLPRWFAPVAAGFAMLATTIANEYGWYPRVKDSLPKDVVVAQTVENTAFYRPWTFVFPFVERFVAIDMASVRTHPAQPAVRLAETYFFGRWSPVSKLPVVADCVALKRAALMDGVSFEDDGAINGITWTQVAAEDPIVSTVCRTE
ncbi:hypothetical protein K1718_09490 [Roseibium porphyridii]|uniref:Uncharacterized protein n=1 Tax=Roseibium porphyridii TaxID=2866279 RepID=A0ABY8F7U0_9HYPH|nr:hypothetical protein [Roseibium sp. KMA01]WFE91570.1 hypothetical protein K1718_09490 [Roseibium sp. KMA01]